MKIISKAALGFVFWSLSSSSLRAWAGGDYEQARLDAGQSARDLAVSKEVESLLRAKESLVAERRKTGIALIETYLREHQPGPETAEVLFQLAELRWEESKAAFLAQMAVYNAGVEKCAKEAEEREAARKKAQEAAEKSAPGPELLDRSGKSRQSEKRAPAAARVETASADRCRPPAQPRLDLSSSQAIYRRLIAEYPQFRKIDAVRYLLGFSLRNEGRTQEALEQFKAILKDHPQSRFRPDAWMAVAESRFYEDGNYKTALEAYEQVLKFPDSPLYDLALFKTAWCFWKLGDSDKAARRFKEVLDLGSGRAAKGTRADQLTKEGKKRLEELKGEALDYLVQIFTEDEKKGPKDAYDFLSSIGGEVYSRKVINKLADTFFAQARYERAIESERFLIELDPADELAPDRQKRIVEAYREMDENKRAVAELRKLAETYGPQSEWAKKQEDPAVVEHAQKLASKMLRDVAKNLHADAQRVEQYQKHVDPDRYARAADAYAYYLSKFSSESEATEIHYLLGDIYFFKLKKNEEAGDAYLAVGKAKPVGKLHREALLNAIAAYEKVRKEKNAGKTVLPSDKKMGEAIDLYAALFPKDPEIAGILYKNGELFYEHGDYDEAVKRFGKIVEGWPTAPVAAAAGDKILESLNKAKDYENVESWARRLLKVPAFQAKADQERLSKLVVDAGMKAGEQKADKEPLVAASIYLRVANEFPQSARATQALMNAATTYVRGGKPDEAVKVYGTLVDKYQSSGEAPKAAWNAGKLYEQAALWDQASKYYQLLADRYPKDEHAADALYNAGLLRERLGDTKSAINAYSEYAKRYKTRDDVREVAFRVGVIQADSGQRDQAARSFIDFAQRYPGGPKAIEALSRAGAELIKAGQHKRAEEPLGKAVALYRKSSPSERGPAGPAAHARYLQGEIIFHDFERLQLASDARRLKKTLDEKSALLEKAKAVFVDTVTFGDPEWATAALYRIGEGYERFAKALRGAPVPPGLNAEEQQVYREELEKVVIVVEEKAIDAYKSGYKKALELGVYNDFTQKLRQALGRLDDQEFPAEVEARARTAPAEPRAELPFVGTVTR
jgi:TolA-binding protein